LVWANRLTVGSKAGSQTLRRRAMTKMLGEENARRQLFL
jgi:hypothetical protein